MAFNQASVTPGRLGQNPFAGTTPMSNLGQGSSDVFQRILNAEKFFKDNQIPEGRQNLYLNALTGDLAGDRPVFDRLLSMYERQMSPEEQERQLKLADEYQTKKGWKSAMFNTLTTGLDNLSRGIAMSMNPYGTPEAARYAADMIAGSGAAMANAYAAARNQMAIPAVQGGSAPTYF
jgi:hypothetical protein